MSNQSLESLLSLSGKTTIVTGSAMGIGEGIARRLAEAGANVVLADKNESALQAAEAALRTDVTKIASIATDMSKLKDIERMVEFTVKTFGSVDILVNNAGIYPSISLMEVSSEELDTIFSVNLRGAILATKAAAAQMIKQGRGGRVINITSIDALHPSMPGLAAYDASKHGLWGFTKNAALELAPHKIWVNAIAPGGINTPGTRTKDGAEMQEVMNAFIKRIPMGRMGEPDDVGRVALFLASELSSYMTGSQIIVDGGYLLR